MKVESGGATPTLFDSTVILCLVNRFPPLSGGELLRSEHKSGVDAVFSNAVNPSDLVFDVFQSFRSVNNMVYVTSSCRSFNVLENVCLSLGNSVFCKHGVPP
jgi:hypothetical protein